MKALIGLGMILASIVVGLYVGIWVCFIGGIVQVIEAMRAPELSSWTVAVGVAKIFFAGLAGWLSAALLFFPGAALIESDK
jgi:uncharacterized membrane protein